MYITTIIKTTLKDNVFAGFNMSSAPLLKWDLHKELFDYNVNSQGLEEVHNMKTGDRKMIETIWKNYHVFITLYKVA